MFLFRCDDATNPPKCYRAPDAQGVVDAQLSSDSRHLMVHYEDGAVRVWDTQTDGLVFLLQDNEVKVVRAVLSPKGAFVLTISDDGVSQLWRTEDGTEKSRFTGYEYQISAVSFTHDERVIVAGSEDGTVYFWDFEQGNSYSERHGQRGHPISSIAVARDNSKVATVSHVGRTIVLWDIETTMPLSFDARSEENRPMAVAFDPSGEFLIVPTVHGLGETRVLTNASWPSDKWQDSVHLMAAKLEGMQGRDEFPILATDSTLEEDWGIRAVFSPDGRTLAILHQSSTIGLWEWPSRKQRHSIPHQDDMLTRISFSADSRYLITAPNIPARIIPDGGKFDARIAHIYNVMTGAEALVLFGHNDLVMASEIAADGASIMTASKDGNVLVWVVEPEAIAELRRAGDTSPIVAALRTKAARNSVGYDEDISDELVKAARKGYSDDLTTMLAAGASPDAEAEGAMPILLEAAWNDRIATVDLLLKYGADINRTNASGQTALYIAAMQDSDDMVQLLLDHEPDVNLQEWTKERTALYESVRNASVDITRRLLERGADPNKKFAMQDRSRDRSIAETVLMLAAEQGQLEILKLLLKSGADPNVSNAFGQTALHIAAGSGAVDMVRLLLDAGADPEVTRSETSTPLDIAVDKGNTSIIDLLLAAGATMHTHSDDATTDLYELAKKGGHPAIVMQLLDQGADPVKPVKSGFSPLHIAATNGHTDVVAALLTRCSTVDVRLDSGATPLVSAATGGHTEIVKVLLKAGADPAATTSFGESALNGAIRNRHGDTIVALLDGGAPFAADSDGAADLLALAAKHGLLSLVEKLHSLGVTSNAELAQLRRAAADARHREHAAPLIAERNAHLSMSVRQQAAEKSEPTAIDDAVVARANELLTFQWGGFVEDEQIEIEESLVLDPEAKTVTLNRFRREPVVVQLGKDVLDVRTLQGSKLSSPVDEFNNRSWLRHYDYVPDHKPYEIVHQIIVDDADYDTISALLRPIGHFPNMHVTTIYTAASGAFLYTSPNTKIQFVRESDS